MNRHRALGALGALALAPAFTAATAAPLLRTALAGGGEPGPDWYAAGLEGPVVQLSLTGDFLYALTRPAGATTSTVHRTPRHTQPFPQWSSLRAPGPRSARLAVDTEHGHILFVDGEEGLYRSTDAGESWSLVLPVPPGLPPPYSQWTSAVSPADPAVVYATASYLSSARVWRSPDGGTSWEQLRQLSATLCGWSFPVVEPDSVVRERVYLAYGCLAGRTLSIPLRVSQDLWATDGETIFSPPPSRSTDPLHYLYPRRVAFEPQGRHGLLGADRDARLGGSVLARTDDGGTSWRPLLAFLPPPATPPGPHARVADFVAELPALNRLFVGLAGTDQGVLRSEDGGTIWRRLGSAAIGPVNTLAVDWSAGLLYAGTTRGLWLLPLP